MEPKSRSDDFSKLEGATETGIDRRPQPFRALILEPVLFQRREGAEAELRGNRSPEARLEEAVGLSAAINLDIVSAGVVKISNPKPATLFGEGKVSELAGIVEAEDVDLVVVDHPLSPIQQRNLERRLKTKVIDRTGLILEIFGDRARTKEGKLQVDLAHLTWQKSRLVRSWTHLERQRGGVGFMGGPGETQIESDRRQIQDRITALQKQLEGVRRTRDLHRKKRKKIPQPTVALVGYTNAGKSTLFNRLTKADVFAKDLLFATLDPTLRKITLPHGREVILSDTVGFVSDLPTTLIAAFRATLEEVISADIIVHVRDVAHSDTDVQKTDVLRVMSELGVEFDDTQVFLEVLNKTDLLPPDALEAVENTAARDANIVAMSAVTGRNTDHFLHRLDMLLSADRGVVTLRVPQGDGAAISWLYRNADVLSRDDGGEHAELEVSISPEQLARFEKNHPIR